MYRACSSSCSGRLARRRACCAISCSISWHCCSTRLGGTESVRLDQLRDELLATVSSPLLQGLFDLLLDVFLEVGERLEGAYVLAKSSSSAASTRSLTSLT